MSHANVLRCDHCGKTEDSPKTWVQLTVYTAAMQQQAYGVSSYITVASIAIDGPGIAKRCPGPIDFCSPACAGRFLFGLPKESP